MNKTLCIILEDQLFENHPALQTEADFLIVESIYNAKRRNFHKFKLAYQFTLMREYKDFLEQKGKKVWYFEIDQNINYQQAILKIVLEYKYANISLCQPNYEYSATSIIDIIKTTGIKVEILSNPMFLTSQADFKNYLSSKKSKYLIMRDFYSWQRVRLGILIFDKNKPVGSKWSFDEDNRQKLSKNIKIPPRQSQFKSDYFKNVSAQIETLFPANPGEINSLWLPTTHKQALVVLNTFFEQCLANFGTYEDALTTQDPFVFHSVISPLLNYGLLTPSQVLEQLDFYLINEHNFSLFKSTKVPKVDSFRYASVEGFVRQIIGWREWVKGMYDTQYDLENLTKYNFFKSVKKLPSYFWNSNSLELTDNLPLRLALQKTYKYSWNHHIERLMIIANWMTINEYDPMACLNWFSEMYVDAFDWVMVPNVLGMGLFADGGLYATKPYVAGGNYIKKMSDYPESKIWEKIWTDAFWNFLEKHSTYFKNNYRLGMLLKARKKQQMNKNTNNSRERIL